MGRTINALAIAAGLIGSTIPAAANERSGYAAIAAKDWAGAERVLLTELKIHPGRPELLLNLAAVYARTGRADRARELYAAVLDRPAIAMDLPSGEVRSSHMLAQVALARAPAELAAAR